MDPRKVKTAADARAIVAERDSARVPEAPGSAVRPFRVRVYVTVASVGSVNSTLSTLACNPRSASTAMMRSRTGASLFAAPFGGPAGTCGWKLGREVGSVMAPP